MQTLTQLELKDWQSLADGIFETAEQRPALVSPGEPPHGSHEDRCQPAAPLPPP
jgi:hypothetical protein